jgi:prepilin-type N-terminal cleavage/methylation domain-containing protein
MRGGFAAFTVFVSKETVMLTSRNHLARFYARAHRGMTLLEIMIVLAILALVMGIIVGPRVIRSFVEARHKTTRLKLNMVAFQAYPAWSAAHPEKDCPDALADLDPYMNNDDMDDEWGTPMTMLCGASLPPGARGIAVTSAGEDHKAGTADDLHSWDPAK